MFNGFMFNVEFYGYALNILLTIYIIDCSRTKFEAIIVNVFFLQNFRLIVLTF